MDTHKGYFSNLYVGDGILEMAVGIYVYVCMYRHTYSKSMDQPDKVDSPARGQLNRENEHFPVRVRA